MYDDLETWKQIYLVKEPSTLKITVVVADLIAKKKTLLGFLFKSRITAWFTS